MPAQTFGDLLREFRRQKDKKLGDLARLLNVSTVYVSDVERGNRRPFATDRIVLISNFLEIDPTPLLKAADRERGVIEYDITNARPLEARVVGELVTGLARGGVSDEQLSKIQKILKEDEK
jgi:transcriptional regulator with XRE-family HTH domain